MLGPVLPIVVLEPQEMLFLSPPIDPSIYSPTRSSLFSLPPAFLSTFLHLFIIPPILPSLCLFIHLSTDFFLSIHPFVYPSVLSFCLPSYPSSFIHPSFHLSIQPSIHPVHPMSFFSSTHLSILLFLHSSTVSGFIQSPMPSFHI